MIAMSIWINVNIIYSSCIKLYSLLLDAWQQSKGNFISMMIVFGFSGITIIIVSYVTHSFIHELGHLISGVLCGAKLIRIKFPFVLVKKTDLGYKIYLHTSMFRNECILTEFTCNKTKLSALFISLGGIWAQIMFTIFTVMMAYHSQSIYSIIYLIWSTLGISIIIINLNIFSQKWVCDGIIAKEILFEKDGGWNYNYYGKLQRLLLHQNYGGLDIDYIKIQSKQLQDYRNVDGWNFDSNITHFIFLIYIKVYISKNQYNKAYQLLSDVLKKGNVILEELRLELEIEQWYIRLLYWGENISIMGKDIVTLLKELKASKNEIYYIRCNLAYELIICKKSVLVLEVDSILNSLKKKGILDCEYRYLKDEIPKIIKRAEGVNINGCIR